MKKHLLKGVIVAVALAAGMHAHAWEATAVDGQSDSYMRYDTYTPQDAQDGALKDCEAKGSGDCTLVGKPVNATAVVFARGDGGWGHAAAPNPDKAARDALAQCAKSAKHCRVINAVWDEGASWSSIAQSPEHTGIGFGDTPADAEAQALASCRSHSKAAAKDCTVLPDSTISGHLYFGVAKGPKGWGLGWEKDRDSARNEAMKQCAGMNGGDGSTCKLDADTVGESPAPAPMPASMQKILAEVKQNEAAAQTAAAVVSRSQQRNVVTCFNQCTNGDCIRTFPNGHKERWQAPRVYDPSTSDWKWDTSSCGT